MVAEKQGDSAELASPVVCTFEDGIATEVGNCQVELASVRRIDRSQNTQGDSRAEARAPVWFQKETTYPIRFELTYDVNFLIEPVVDRAWYLGRVDGPVQCFHGQRITRKTFLAVRIPSRIQIVDLELASSAVNNDLHIFGPFACVLRPINHIFSRIGIQSGKLAAANVPIGHIPNPQRAGLNIAGELDDHPRASRRFVSRLRKACGEEYQRERSERCGTHVTSCGTHVTNGTKECDLVSSLITAA